MSDDGTPALDDAARLARFDTHDVRSILTGFPEQCRRAVALAPVPPVAVERPRLVVLAGMGGSAAGGDVLAACAAECVDVPVLVHRGYGLPAAARAGALIIASSYSGDTAETLSAAETALARGLPLVAITTGGRLGRLAAARGCSAVIVPGGLMPRMALGYLLLAGLGVLAAAGLEVATPAAVSEAVDGVAELARELAPAQPSSANQAKRLALAVEERLPAIYGGPLTGVAAYRWKTDFAENAKAFALAGTVPEMNHNAIEAWRAPAARGLQPLFLRDREEPPEIARRFGLLTEMIGSTAGSVVECWASGKSPLARLLSTVYVGQWTSYYLALLRGVDPWPTPRLDELKRRLTAP